MNCQLTCLNYIENIWNEGCYLEGIGFQRVSISDIQSNKILLIIFNGKLHSIINYCLSIFEILVFAMASFSTIYDIKHKNINYQNFILILCFLGGFMFHFIWETKCIYVIPFFFLLLPSSANGLALIFNLIDNKLINKKLIDNK